MGGVLKAAEYKVFYNTFKSIGRDESYFKAKRAMVSGVIKY